MKRREISTIATAAASSSQLHRLEPYKKLIAIEARMNVIPMTLSMTRMRGFELFIDPILRLSGGQVL
jgi:hypothetical protein